MKTSCVLILGNLGHVIVNWDTKKKHKKNGNFWLEKLLNCLKFQNHLTCKAAIWTQCGCLWMLYRNQVWGALGYVTKILQAKSGQKVDNFESVYLGNYLYSWKMVSDFWAHYQLPFFWLCSFTPTWILFFFFFFLFLTSFFLFYSPAIYF